MLPVVEGVYTCFGASTVFHVLEVLEITEDEIVVQGVIVHKTWKSIMEGPQKYFLNKKAVSHWWLCAG